jgi:hypothetical protein
MPTPTCPPLLDFFARPELLGQQYSGKEISAMLTDAGFREVEAKPTFGYWSIVTGRKP